MTGCECQKRCGDAARVYTVLRMMLWLAAALLLLAVPDTASEGVRAGLALCAQSVIPSLFPFLVLSPMLECVLLALLSRLPVLRRRPRAGAVLSAYAVGMTAGFPLGAVSVLSMVRQGRLSAADAKALIGICTGASPAFLIGYFGCALWADAAIGLYLWCVQSILCLCPVLLLLRHMPPLSGVCDTEKISLPPLSVCLREAVVRMWNICGAIVFFSVIRAVLCRYLPFGAAAVLGGLAEMTGGLRECAALSDGGRISRRTALVLSAAMIGFGGCCVGMQTADVVLTAGIPMRRYWRQRAVIGIAMASAAYLYCAVFCG